MIGMTTANVRSISPSISFTSENMNRVRYATNTEKTMTKTSKSNIVQEGRTLDEKILFQNEVSFIFTKIRKWKGKIKWRGYCRYRDGHPVIPSGAKESHLSICPSPLSFRTCREISSSNSGLFEDELINLAFSSSPEAVFEDEMNSTAHHQNTTNTNTVFIYCGIFTKSGLERLTGINQKQLWHYANGKTSPAEHKCKRSKRLSTAWEQNSFPYICSEQLNNRPI